MTSTRRYKVLGTTDTAAGCDCCGRTNLKVYVALEPVEGGTVLFYGTGCAAKAEGATNKEIATEAKAADAAIKAAANEARRVAQEAKTALWFAWLTATAGTGDVAEQIARLGGFAAASAAYQGEQAAA